MAKTLFLIEETFVKRRRFVSKSSFFEQKIFKKELLIGKCFVTKKYVRSKKTENEDDLFCTNLRLCQNNMTHVALRGRGQPAPITVFQLQVCYSNLKFLLVSKEARPRPHVRSTGALCLATLTPKGDQATSMATWLSSSLRNENGKLKIFVVRTTLLAKSHRC